MENKNYTGPEPAPGVGNTQELAGDQKEVEKEQQEEDSYKKDYGEDAKMALSEDPTKVKFTNSVNRDLNNEGNKNGEAKVDIENVQVAFAGMGKEELLRYADDPFWVKMRWSLFMLFWLAWAAMLVGAIAIVVTTPGCPPLPTREWWQKGVIYQVYPRSFKDSNNDGIGDLQGITSKVDYFKELGVNTIWLSPVYKSPMMDGGYDVSNFTDIDPIFGTLEDFQAFMTSAKNNGLYVIMDFIPNHSSDQHPWFKDSQLKNGNYTDYYVWRDGSSATTPPNNWKSVFGGSAWEFDATRKQYYLHQFLKSQPDLNLRAEAVQEELKTVLRFWLDLGVDGFRVDAAKHFFEDEQFRDEPPLTNASRDVLDSPDDYASLDHCYTTGLSENFELIQQWREVLKEYETDDGHHRLLIVEAPDEVSKVMLYYGNESRPLADFPFNFELAALKGNVSGKDVFSAVSSWINALPTGMWPNWILGNHDISRLASRTHPDLVDAFNMIIHLLSGTPVTYYGEEIGMVDGMVPFALAQDMRDIRHGEALYSKYSRDFQRTPMQWSNDTNAGFSNSAQTWLPVSSTYQLINVESQQTEEDSHLNVYKKLVKLRNEPVIIYGELHYPIISEDIFSFARVKKGTPGYLFVANFGKNETVVQLTEKSCCESFKFPQSGLVEVRSSNVSPNSQLVVLGAKARINLDNFVLGPREAVVFKFVPNFT